MTDKNVVELHNVSKTVDGEPIIRDLSFSIRRGEILGLLGPNGAGKTFTIRMMVGLITMTDGDIFIEGHSIRTDRTKALQHVGAIVENPDLYGYMTGMQNLKHFARMYDTSISRERIMEIVRLVELSDAIHRKVKTYSLGMRQRLGIAQALLHQPGVLILDEPTNGLDPVGIHQLRGYLYKLVKEEGIAIIVSSHLLAEVELMCDRVVIIQNGMFVGEHNIKERKDSVTAVEVAFEVTEPDKAVLLLASFGTVQAVETTIMLKLPKQQVPAIVALLVESGIGIYQVNIRTESLEETFLTLTGGTRL
ncbi:ABC transporter ATP-binding protein [Aneurinibacillus tyrosinisolvens]|uniref:ABC transporter ATP-binding protein n=1 Tax=Aneurinibacillus tyrosinisolvens TaxID=1443435 RepID=UPI00063F7916|nr:ABC transporter ATP-binding protein [Aneurinibacillus tyrosinisolvens]